MPDSLVSLSTPISQPLALLHRQMKEAERICDETCGEGDNGPSMQAFFRAHDRFIDAPVSSLSDILLKLELATEHEDFEATLEDEPKLVYARVILNLLRDLRALSVGATPAFELASAAAPALDILAIHRAADEQVDEIYGLLGRLDGGLLALREIGESVCAGPDNWNKLRFVIDGISDIADDLLTANDAVTTAIDPLNPTVLDEQVA